ncbi:Protein CBG01863 [Caenorhabditis briggsae]|uniref:Protein CBG01863 n=1 Tax=Caenorhabditis briggsae TaxID=6238 RepID=A8WRG4_CAEBR|nr:Protein CBG01863 [Caenorhabditis briggsae]CAP23072.2 Protein CBG01863 [Caenorhabditis briggsae]
MNQTYEQNFTEVIDPIATAAHVTWSLTALIGIPANLFVLAAIVYFRDMRTISNIYIFNLALADLLFLCAIPVTFFGRSMREGWRWGPIMCKLYISGNAVSQFASAVFIAILSFDRYLAVCRPIQSKSFRTTQAAVILSIAAWAMVIIEMTPLFLFVKLIKTTTGGHTTRSCMLFVGNVTALETLDESIHDVAVLNEVEQNMLTSRRFFISYTFALSYLIPLVAVWFFYFKIILKMCQQKQQMQTKRTGTKRRTAKVTIMGLAIVISYTHCWLPFWIVQWSIEANLFQNSKYLLFVFTHFAFALQYINSAANPFLYVFLSDSFQKNMQKLLRTAKPDKQISLKSTTEPLDTTRMITVTANPTCSTASDSC